jgi:hypothetical protein
VTCIYILMVNISTKEYNSNDGASSLDFLGILDT